MTRRDFELIARLIRTLPAHAVTRDMVAEHFVEGLKQTNPRFDPNRFIAAAVK